jgi:hypothetical protein
MDRVDQVRVRNGKIPPNVRRFWRRNITGVCYSTVSERRRSAYVEQLREHARNVAVLRYGFQFRKTDLSERTLRDSVDAVINRTRKASKAKMSRSAR